MVEYLWVGQKLFHKYLGFITVTFVSDNELLADTGSKGILPFAFNNFGRVLFFDEDHKNTAHKTYNDYLVFYQEDLKNKAFQKTKSDEENERLNIEKLEEAAREELEKIERKRRAEEAKKNLDRKNDTSRIDAEIGEANNRKLIALKDKGLSITVKENQCRNIVQSQEILLKIKKEHEDKIKEAVKKRRIEHLFHFTRIENLQGILQHGLVPVSMQGELGIISIHNDDKRFDQRRDCTSCSVGFPNWQLFYNFQKRDPKIRWAIIRLKTEVLFSPQSINLYCETNAARVLSRDQDLRKFCSYEAFESMFCDSIKTNENKHIQRNALSIVDYMTTDPQAEILISDIIDIKYIDSICFRDVEDRRLFIQFNGAAELKLFDNSIIPYLFSQRKDFKFWEKENRIG